MKWTYSIRNKMVASGALLSLCLLVLFSNYIDRDHTENVKNAISTLYEDRLIVEDYILKMTNHVYQIKEALGTPDSTGEGSDRKIAALLADIDKLSTAYLKTKFTKSEDIKFADLLVVLAELAPSHGKSPALKYESANQALVLLTELSAIQLEESKLIMDQAEKLYASSKLSSQFAYAVIFIILLVLQALVFTSKTLVIKDPAPKSNLN